MRQGRQTKQKGLTISIGDEGGSGATGVMHAQTARASKKPMTLDFNMDDEQS